MRNEGTTIHLTKSYDEPTRSARIQTKTAFCGVDSLFGIVRDEPLDWCKERICKHCQAAYDKQQLPNGESGATQYEAEVTGYVRRAGRTTTATAWVALPADWDIENDRTDDISGWDESWDAVEKAARKRGTTSVEATEVWATGNTREAQK